MSSEDQFKAAVNVIKRLPKNGPFQPSDDLKLRFYALFKQATEGPNQTKKPPFYDIVNRYKWDAWKRLGEMDTQTAMDSYIDELKKVIETMSFNESVSEFYEVLGPFHEFLPQEANGSDDNSNGLHNDDNEDNELNVKNNIEQQKMKVGKKIPKNPYKDMSQTNGDDLGIDSEGEEFSDTYDHIGENGEIPVVERNGSDFSIKDMVSVRGGNDSSNPSAHISPSNSTNNRNVSSMRSNNGRGVPSAQDLRPHNSRGDGGSGGHGSNPHDYSIGINEQLALAVIRLQQSMDQVVNRLDALESMLSRETRTKPSPKRQKSSIWPFEELRPQTALVLIVWPFVVQLIVQYIQHKRRNK
ncbi:unnamed protein product [Medioppia subpectinata]|uniref:ACB domain-containing protein n=1 Tax=Medioppia subpectinata TaxID=1979941 RepID=A0A7R9KU85_9ACAR|nr:unnamed protein product [Medioppia subpectinata]CAG2109598.1 unnamed protein product [Medioppia subpectinata]